MPCAPSWHTVHDYARRTRDRTLSAGAGYALVAGITELNTDKFKAALQEAGDKKALLPRSPSASSLQLTVIQTAE